MQIFFVLFVIVPITIVLLGVSAFFSLSETALVSLSHYRLKKLMLKRKSVAPLFRAWLAEPQYILTAILIGNNVANISITTIVTASALAVLPALPPRVVELGVWLGLMVIIIVLCEITPKVYARRYPEAVSLAIIRALALFSLLFRPLSAAITALLYRIAPGSVLPQARPVTRMTIEEIRRLIRESGVQGTVERGSTEMMQKVLSLHDTIVGRIMTPMSAVECIDIDAFYGHKVELIDTINEIGHTRIPIVKGGVHTVIGYLNVKDIFINPDRALSVDMRSFIRTPLILAASTKVADALLALRQSDVHIAIIQDESARAIGILTLEDVIEEIVGEIMDEYDAEEQPKG